MKFGTITLTADKVDIGKKRIDGTRVVSLECGEYQHQELAKILLIPEQTNCKVTIEVENE